MLHNVEPKVQHMIAPFPYHIQMLIRFVKTKKLETRCKNNKMSQKWDIVICEEDILVPWIIKEVNNRQLS
jgi:hypothetical protein